MRAFAISLVLAGCGRISFDPVDIGVDASLASGPFSTPAPVPAIMTAASEQEPSFTDDRLELFYRESDELFVSSRSSTTEPWGPPVILTDLNSSSAERTPGIAGDGLTVWFSSNRPGGLGGFDIWVSTRPDRAAMWSPPIAVPELSSPDDDYNPMVRRDEMWFKRTNDIYVAARTSPTTWGVPRLVPELSTSGNEGSMCTWGGGLYAVFYANRGGTGGIDIWSAERASLTDPFANIVEVTELNSLQTDWDVWISEDGHHVMFGSNRAGTHDIYEASR